MYRIVIWFVCLISVRYVQSNKKTDIIKNDKFLDYGLEWYKFVPLNDSNFNSNNLNNLNYNHPLNHIKSKALNVSVDTSNLDKRKQRDIVVKLIDSIVFDYAGDHQIGKLRSADQLPQIANKYPKVDLSMIKLEYLGSKLLEKRKFNHYMIIKKQVKKPNNDYLSNRNNFNNLDNSLFYTYQSSINQHINMPFFSSASLSAPIYNRNGNRKSYKHAYHQSKSLGESSGQFVFCSVFIQKSVKFGRKAIRIAFYQSLNNNLNENSLQNNNVHNVWLTDSQRFKPSTALIPVQPIHILSGMGMLYSSVFDKS